jgi:NAD(P)H-dependent flavin oxidoreductase YrpB (nitropropane dioxygenase family)
MTSGRLTLRTSLCDLLGIEYPILQSGMGLIAGTDLVASVSESGGLGIVAGFMVPADKLREAIRAVRDRTNRPFGVNLWLSADLRSPSAGGEVLRRYHTECSDGPEPNEGRPRPCVGH